MTAERSLLLVTLLLVFVAWMAVCYSPAEAHKRWPDFTLSGMSDAVIFCGQADENGTIYYGPNILHHRASGADSSIGSAACDALDSAVEATANSQLFDDEVTYRVTGMWCVHNGILDAGETVDFTLRVDSADGPLTCSLAEADDECMDKGLSAKYGSANQLAIEAVQVSNNVDDDGWCRVYLSLE